MKQEQERAGTDVVEVAPGVLRMQLPVDLPGLGHTNCYALEDERGLAVIDPGLPGDASWSALLAPAGPGRRARGPDPHRRRHPLAPRPLRPGRPAPGRERRRAAHPRELPHLVEPRSARHRRPRRRRADADRAGGRGSLGAQDAVGPRELPATRRHGRRGGGRVPQAARQPDAHDPGGGCRGGAARPARSGWRCTRPATPPTTCACSTRPPGCSSPATTCCRRSRRTSRGSGPSEDPLTEFFDSLDRMLTLDGVGPRAARPRPAVHRSRRPGHRHQAPPRGAPRAAAQGLGRARAGGDACRSCRSTSSTPGPGGRWPRARPTPTSSTSAGPARRCAGPSTACCSTPSGLSTRPRRHRRPPQTTRLGSVFDPHTTTTTRSLGLRHVGARAQGGQGGGTTRLGHEPQGRPQRSLRVADGVVAHEHRVAHEGRGAGPGHRSRSRLAPSESAARPDTSTSTGEPAAMASCIAGMRCGSTLTTFTRSRYQDAVAGDQPATADGDEHRGRRPAPAPRARGPWCPDRPPRRRGRTGARASLRSPRRGRRPRPGRRRRSRRTRRASPRSPSMRSRFRGDVISGTNTSTGRPRARPAKATAAPWLPPEAATRAAGQPARSASASTRLNAPRGLNEPACWSSSSFRVTGHRRGRGRPPPPGWSACGAHARPRARPRPGSRAGQPASSSRRSRAEPTRTPCHRRSTTMRWPGPRRRRPRPARAARRRRRASIGLRNSSSARSGARRSRRVASTSSTADHAAALFMWPSTSKSVKRSGQRAHRRRGRRRFVPEPGPHRAAGRRTAPKHVEEAVRQRGRTARRRRRAPKAWRHRPARPDPPPR